MDMLGLEYIRKQFDMSVVDVAKKLDVSRQFVSKWEKGEKTIPLKYLPLLESMFHIPQQYYQKELSKIDKLKIQQLKLDQDLANSTCEYEDYIYDEQTGEEIPVTRTYYDQGMIEYQQHNDTVIQKLETLEKIDEIISDEGEADDLYSIMGRMSNRTRLFDRFANIIQSDEISYQLLNEIMRAIELATRSLNEKNRVWGKGRPNSEAVEDERPIVQELYGVINKSIQKRNEEAMEIMSLFQDSQDDDLY